jgi:hypothetical protein
MLFDTKMDFTQKAHLFDCRHFKEVPPSLTKSIRIMFLIADLNDLQILGTNIGNAYLNVSNGEKVNAISGKEFGNK